MKKGILVLIAVLMTWSGCIFVDDGDDHHHSINLEETVIYINRTGYSIENYIDGDFVGTVAPNTELYVYDYYFDGRHEFYSHCLDCDLEWGPTEFVLYDGEVFRVYLELAGMYGQGNRTSADQKVY
jgi:hypothetical protein